MRVLVKVMRASQRERRIGVTGAGDLGGVKAAGAGEGERVAQGDWESDAIEGAGEKLLTPRSKAKKVARRV